MTQPNSGTSITPAEEAARRSRRGYEYQDLVAASFCLQMLRDGALQKVACETQDDVVLTWGVGSNVTQEEFVQIKSDRLKQQWSVAIFCDQEPVPTAGNGKKTQSAPQYRKDTSIFEKNALRDRGTHSSRFRIVTRADVSELRVLTEAIAARNTAATAELARKLETKLDGKTTLNAANIDYWVANALWNVRGEDSAVFNENFRKLSEAMEALERRVIPATDLERILSHLALETRAMAVGKGRTPASPSAITADEMRAWLSAEVAAVPHFLGPAENEALLQEERGSQARCEGLWLALGVSESDASALARQPEIGARTDFFTSLAPGFHWVTATYGAGKSLAVERMFQTHLADYAARRDYRVPIFLRANSINGALRDAVNSRVRELDRDGGAPPLLVILDAVDEAGVGPGHRLMQEARELSVTWPGSTVIATSTELPFSFDQFRRRLPSLDDEDAARIVSHFAQNEVSGWAVRDRLGNDFGLALMCVLLGMALNETADATPSRGELLDRVIEAARKRSGADATGWAEQADLLCRIAMLSTDAGGGPVRPSELHLTRVELTPLAATRLVAEEGGNLVFTVATMRLWFAAQALRKGWVNATELTADLARLRHWQEPLTIFIATTDFDSAARYFEPIAASHPAVAAQIIDDATSQWGKGTGRTPSEFAAFAQRIRRCLEAWLRGILPLAPVCSFTDQRGNPLKVMAGFSAPNTLIVFSSDPALPLASALPPDWRNNHVRQFNSYRETDEPSHLWRKTHAMVCSELLKHVKYQKWELADDGLFHENVWNQVAGFAHIPYFSVSSIPWEVVDHSEHIFRHVGMWDWLCNKKREHPAAFPAPHPPADLYDVKKVWIPSFFFTSGSTCSRTIHVRLGLQNLPTNCQKILSKLSTRFPAFRLVALSISRPSLW